MTLDELLDLLEQDVATLYFDDDDDLDDLDDDDDLDDLDDD